MTVPILPWLGGNPPLMPEVQPDVPPIPHSDNPGSAVASTTAEHDRGTAGQRNINLIWETTQQKIALFVVGGALLVAISLGVAGKLLGSPDMQLAALVFLFAVANLVIGFYFGRTNHSRTGGIGGDETTR